MRASRSLCCSSGRPATSGSFLPPTRPNLKSGQWEQQHGHANSAACLQGQCSTPTAARWCCKSSVCPHFGSTFSRAMGVQSTATCRQKTCCSSTTTPIKRKYHGTKWLFLEPPPKKKSAARRKRRSGKRTRFLRTCSRGPRAHCEQQPSTTATARGRTRARAHARAVSPCPATSARVDSHLGAGAFYGCSAGQGRGVAHARWSCGYVCIARRCVCACAVAWWP
jgi:hypothetical protein